MGLGGMARLRSVPRPPDGEHLHVEDDDFDYNLFGPGASSMKASCAGSAKKWR